MLPPLTVRGQNSSGQRQAVPSSVTPVSPADGQDPVDRKYRRIRRHRSHLRESDGTDGTLETLRSALDEGRDVVLVCYESDEKRCHRHILVDELRDRV